MFFYFDVNFKISHRKNRYFIWMSFYLNEFNYSNSVEKTENNEKTPKKTEKKQNRSAIFMMVGFYYFDPGVGNLYFGVFLNTM